jgi:putative ABC transport system permease protein
MLEELHSVGKADSIWIKTTREDETSEAAAAESLRAYYTANQLEVSLTSPFGQDTAHQIVADISGRIAVIVYLLGAMAIVTALVGSIALSGVLSINVMERTREIGVMRAVGASSAAIASLFVGEGVVLGLLSWAIALPLSIPAGRLMTSALGSVVGGEIVYNYSETGVLYWLGIIVVLSILASWLPAQNAARVSVRESLAYQ